MFCMRRRGFIRLFGSAAVWPFAARAQPIERMRRILVLMGTDDAEGQARMTAFVQGLQQLGWADGRNLRIEARWTAGKAENIRRYVAEVAALTPDVIMATGSSIVGPLVQSTRDTPIVFAQVPDPVGAGFVESLARPGGNATGFISFEYGLSAKWLELLKEIAPTVTRAAILRDPGITAGIGQWGAIQTAAVARRRAAPSRCPRSY
jgi:putative ABC transport system substrate-binding protein